GNESKSSNTSTQRTRDECPKILPKRQPRLRNTLDTRTQHRLDIPRHSHHRNAHPPLLARIRLHPRHSIQLLRPINRTHTTQNPETEKPTHARKSSPPPSPERSSTTTGSNTTSSSPQHSASTAYQSDSYTSEPKAETKPKPSKKQKANSTGQ